MEFSDGHVAGKAAIMMLQSLILALLDREILSGEDILQTLEDVIDAQRSADGEPEALEGVLRIATSALEEVTTR